MKKFTKVMLVVSLLLLLVFVACSCGDKEEPTECVHANKTTIEGKAATCTENGLTTGAKCTDCGVTTTAQQVIPAKGHTEVVLNKKNPTCTEAGLTEGKQCAICQAITVKQETVSPLGHTNVTIEAVAPTCTETGLTAGTKCSVCKEITKAQETIAATGHTEVTVPGKAATCTETGLTDGKKCTVCQTVTVAQTKIDALGHTEEVIAGKAATCTETGLTDGKKCSVCDAELVAQEVIPATGHDTQSVDAQAPTCTEIGWDAYEYCSKCDYTTYVEIPATDHDTQSVDAQDATCEGIGWNAYEYCSKCDYTTYVEIPATGHAWVLDEDKLVGGLPTCQTEGKYAYKCTNGCGEVEYNLDGQETDVIKHLGYVEGQFTTAPTCTTRGIYTCSECGEDFEAYEESGDALGHDYIDHDAQAATCLAIGWDAYQTCSRCDYTTYVEIPALGHDEQPHDAQAQTCLVIGWEAYVTCSRCDYTTYVELPALGHDYVDHPAQAVTCTEIGWDAYQTCSRCDYTTYVEIPATGHTYTAWTISDEPTCTENGEETRGCVDCDLIEKQTVLPLGHDYIDHEAQAATCLVIGWDAYQTCSRCDYTSYVEIEALGHDYIDHDAKEETCLEIGWDAYQTCSRCDYTSYVEIEALGHDYIDHDAKTETCISIGWDAYQTCSRCDYTTYVEIPATGIHNLVAGTVVDPKCEVEGYTIYACDLDENCTEKENRDFTPALDHNMILDESKLTDGAPSCLTNGDWPYICANGCGKVDYNLGEDDVNTGAVHAGYTQGEWKIAPTCITPATYHCTYCDTDFSADLYPEIAGQPTGEHKLDKVLEESTASCTAYGYKVMGCSADDGCTETDVVDWADKLDHTFEVGENYTIVCGDCGAVYENIAAKIEEKSLCNCGEEGCEVDGMKVIVVAATEDDEIEIEGNTPTEAPETDKVITVIALNGSDDTEYTITLKDSEGNVIDSFEITVQGETNEFDITTTFVGNAYVDISEVADLVDTIEITTTADASVSFYTAK